MTLSDNEIYNLRSSSRLDIISCIRPKTNQKHVFLALHGHFEQYTFRYSFNVVKKNTKHSLMLIYEWTNEQTKNEGTNERMNERASERTNERTNEWMNEISFKQTVDRMSVECIWMSHEW
jgi:hypothetical protein